MVCWTGDALLSEFDALPGWQDDIDELDVGHLGEHASGLVAEPRLGTGAAEELPDDEGQKANEDMGIGTIFAVMPDGSDGEILLVDAKGFLCVCEMDLGTPEFFGRPVLDVAAQEIASLAQPRPCSPCVVAVPFDAGVAIFVGRYGDLEPLCHSTVGLSKTTDTLLDLSHVALAFFALRDELLECCLHAFLETVVDRPFLLPAFFAPAENEHLVLLVGRGDDLGLDSRVNRVPVFFEQCRLERFQAALRSSQDIAPAFALQEGKILFRDHAPVHHQIRSALP